MHDIKRYAVIVLVALGSAGHHGQVPSPTRSHVETLASERFGGRQAGSDGERLAADYLVAQLTRLGARPLPGRNDMFVPFEFVAGSRDAGATLRIGAAPFTSPRDVQALSYSDEGEVSGAVVFAGYGIVVPDSQNFGYDSYATLDVKDKVVVVLRYFPEDADPKTKSILARSTSRETSTRKSSSCRAGSSRPRMGGAPSSLA